MEVLYEGHLEKCLNPSDNRKDWKKRYFVLKRALGGGVMTLEYYKDKDWKRLEPKGVLTLYCSFMIEKINDIKKKCAFQISSIENKFLLAALSEDVRTKWCQVLEDNMSVKVFNVTPEDVQSFTSLGDFSSAQCFLEISDVDLKLKSGCREVVAWPFSCIRRYKCRNGTFLVEVGRKAPSGEGIFSFRTTNHQQIFESLDHAVKNRLKNKDGADADTLENNHKAFPCNQSGNGSKNSPPLWESKADRERKNQPKSESEEYNHLNFACDKHSSRGKPVCGANHAMYNHLASARIIRGQKHRGSDFGITHGSNLLATGKLSKSLSSLESAGSYEAQTESYSYLNFDSGAPASPREIPHLTDELKKICDSRRQATGLSSTTSQVHQLSTSAGGNVPEQQYDRLHESRPALHKQPSDASSNRGLNLPLPRPIGNEYDVLNSARSHPIEYPNDGLQNSYDHLQSHVSNRPPASNAVSSGSSSPPKSTGRHFENSRPIGCSGHDHFSPIQEEENFYSVPSEVRVATNVSAKAPKKPDPRSKPLPTPPSSVVSTGGHVPKPAAKPAPAPKPHDKAGVQRVGSPGSPTSSEPPTSPIPVTKAPVPPKTVHKNPSSPYPGGGIGQAIAQAGLVAQLKKNLAVTGFNPAKGLESNPSVDPIKQPNPSHLNHLQLPKKPPRIVPNKTQPVYAVSPFGKEMVEASGNEYMNVPEMNSEGGPLRYDQVGCVIEGDYYETMTTPTGYSQTGDSLNTENGDILYDVPRGEGMYQ